MFCKNCGTEIKKGQFCPRCGMPVNKVPGQEVVYEDGADKTEVLVNAGMESESTSVNDVENNLNAEKVMSVWSYLGLMLLSGIPIVGIIIVIVFAINSSNQNKTNYCRALILMWIISVILALILGTVFSSLFYSLLNSMM